MVSAYQELWDYIKHRNKSFLYVYKEYIIKEKNNLRVNF